MKSTGIVRKIDNLGRVVVPVEIREMLDISEGDLLAISIMDDNIMLSKCHNRCIFCRETEELTYFKNKSICKKCIKNLNE